MRTLVILYQFSFGHNDSLGRITRPPRRYQFSIFGLAHSSL